MHKTLDTVYFFLGFGKHPSHCRIRVYEDICPTPLCRRGDYTELAYEPPLGVNVTVVATALWGQPLQGTSIVNDAEGLASEIRDVQEARIRGRARGNRPSELASFTWIQHSPVTRQNVLGTRTDRYARLCFQEGPDGRFQDPTWHRLTREETEHIIGCRLD